jgi:hypothetical protein
MGKDKSVALFNHATNAVEHKFSGHGTQADNAMTLEATMVHEIAHAIIGPLELDNWVEKLDYWRNETTASGNREAEKPPTKYGKESASEDLADSVAMYFVNRPKLEAICPERAGFIKKMVASWDPQTKEKMLAATAGASAGPR